MATENAENTELKGRFFVFSAFFVAVLFWFRRLPLAMNPVAVEVTRLHLIGRPRALYLHSFRVSLVTSTATIQSREVVLATAERPRTTNAPRFRPRLDDDDPSPQGRGPG